jgi:translation initiation factor 2 alpha subunit (eIF-2alpha)
MTIATTEILEASVRRLFPDRSLDQALAELLFERAQKNLIKYQARARQIEAKYGEPFEAFRQRVLNSQPDFETEQDYFDWELAVTAIADMQAEIQRLKSLGEMS